MLSGKKPFYTYKMGSPRSVRIPKGIICFYGKLVGKTTSPMDPSNGHQLLELGNEKVDFLEEIRIRFFIQRTIGCTPNSVPIVFIVFSRDSWG